MKISCDCGQFKAGLTAFPSNSPGRLVCYCADCQSFAQRIGRADVLDSCGGTEVVPVYPCEIEFLSGQDQLKCHKLTAKGTLRWTASCCNSPIGNTKAGFPWLGLFHSTFTAQDKSSLSKIGQVRGGIYGRDAKGTPPHRVSDKVGLRETLLVMPFIIKGKLLKKHRNSPFFEADNVTPVCQPELLSG